MRVQEDNNKLTKQIAECQAELGEQGQVLARERREAQATRSKLERERQSLETAAAVCLPTPALWPLLGAVRLQQHCR